MVIEWWMLKMERLHMNERIDKLIEECTDRHFSECVGGFETFDKEKFAELIVEEMYCFMVDATDNDKPWPSFKEVKQHFGVEE